MSFFLKKQWKNWKNWTLLGYHSKDWTFFFVENMTQRIELFFAPFDSKNCSFFFSCFKYLDLFHMTQRIKPSFLRDSNTWTFLKIFDSKKWTLIFFRTQSFFHQSKITHRIEFFLNPTHRIDFFLWIRSTELIFFFNTTHRIEHFFNRTHSIEPFFLNMTHRNIDSSWIWRKELNR